MDRRFHVYCVGSAKSGTHSIASIFAQNYASSHEPEHSSLIQAILARAAGELSDRRLSALLADRDERLRLEMDSSQLNGSVIAHLAALFPASRFILTIRDVYSFVNSAIDHHMARAGGSENWRRMNQHKFGGFPHTPHDRILEEKGLYPLNGYLAYWSRHNQCVLRAVSPDRLLIVRTNEIGQSMERIAGFAGVDIQTLDRTSSHAYPAVQKLNVLATLDRAYVEDRVHDHCHATMTRFFPNLVFHA